ncbi:hypothetical protein H8959_016260 [Pygathrix nigripes]
MARSCLSPGKVGSVRPDLEKGLGHRRTPADLALTEESIAEDIHKTPPISLRLTGSKYAIIRVIITVTQLEVLPQALKLPTVKLQVQAVRNTTLLITARSQDIRLHILLPMSVNTKAELDSLEDRNHAPANRVAMAIQPPQHRNRKLHREAFRGDLSMTDSEEGGLQPDCSARLGNIVRTHCEIGTFADTLGRLEAIGLLVDSHSHEKRTDGIARIGHELP